MTELDDFLSLPDISEITEECKFNINGKELIIKVRAITSDEHTDWIGMSTVTRNGKSDLNIGKYMELAISSCVIEPNFNNSDLLRKTKCANGFELMSKKIPIGVMQDIFSKIQKISGFENINDYVKDAKN